MTDNLDGKSLAELRVMADHLNIKYHPRTGEEKLREQIKQQPKAYVADALKHKAEEHVEPVVFYTEEQINEVIKPYLAKDGFEVKYLSDRTWHFKYKGAEDSGSMSVPLRVIRMKAEAVSRGRRALRGAPGFDSNVAKGYADAIIMG